MNEGDPTNQLPEKLRSKPWRDHKGDLPKVPPTMLAAEELQLLHWLAARYYTGEGAIVDGGCFLGGSTTALASGVAANPAAAGKGRVVHSYDLFTSSADFFDPTFAQFGLKSGDSFRTIYEKNLAPFLDRIEIHEGDLHRQTWGSEKIEILFLDCCKLTSLHDHAVNIWFPRLMPGKSIVIQQDFGWWYYSWGNIMMEAFKDHFVILDDVPVASRVYLCTKAITEEQASRLTYASLSGDDRLRHMENALKTVSREDFKVRMTVNYAQEAQALGRKELVQKILGSIFSSPRVDLVFPFVEKAFRGEFEGPAIASLLERVLRLEAQLAEVTRNAGSLPPHAADAPRKRSFLKKLRRSIRKRMGRPPG